MRQNFLKDQILIFLSNKYLRSSLRIFDWHRTRGKWNEQKINFDGKEIKEKLVVIYRISAKENGKSPIFAKNKFKLVKYCLDSFYENFREVKPYVIFLLDSCPEKFEKLVKKYKFESKVINLEKAGNKGSWFAQIEIAGKLSDDKFVYFAEDDYVYEKNAGAYLLKALEKYDFVTLADHKNYYEKPMVDKKYSIQLIEDKHFRTVESTCLTFGTKASLIKRFKNTFKKYGTFDHPLWMEMKEKGFETWCPIPGLARHLVKEG
jgi:hypothetical protein